MTEREPLLQELRLRTIEVALQHGVGTANERTIMARDLVALMEDGAAALEPRQSGSEPVSIRLPMPKPDQVAEGKPSDETASPAPSIAPETVSQPTPPDDDPPAASLNGVRLPDPSGVRWTDERKAVATIEIEAYGENAVNYAALAKDLAALPGMQPVTYQHVRDWWRTHGRKAAEVKRQRSERSS